MSTLPWPGSNLRRQAMCTRRGADEFGMRVQLLLRRFVLGLRVDVPNNVALLATSGGRCPSCKRESLGREALYVGARGEGAQLGAELLADGRWGGSDGAEKRASRGGAEHCHGGTGGYYARAMLYAGKNTKSGDLGVQWGVVRMRFERWAGIGAPRRFGSSSFGSRSSIGGGWHGYGFLLCGVSKLLLQPIVAVRTYYSDYVYLSDSAPNEPIAQRLEVLFETSYLKIKCIVTLLVTRNCHKVLVGVVGQPPSERCINKALCCCFHSVNTHTDAEKSSLSSLVSPP